MDAMSLQNLEQSKGQERLVIIELNQGLYSCLKGIYSYWCYMVNT